MNIRAIKKEDNAQVKTIIQDSLKSLGLDIPGTAYFDPQLSNLYDYYNNLNHANYWVVELDGEVVGGVGIAPFNEQNKICELQKLYLSPKGQGLGLSNKLMDIALAFASRYYDKCYLETMHQLKTACILYDKYGFSLLNEPLDGSDHSTMNAWYIKDLK